jgi:hypothetical protein
VSTYTSMINLSGVQDIRQLSSRMDVAAYNASDGSYEGMPKWGPQTEHVLRWLQESGPYGDLVSWDTRAANTIDHLYLFRRMGTDAWPLSARGASDPVGDGPSYFNLLGHVSFMEFMGS